MTSIDFNILAKKIRALTLASIHHGGSGHCGPALSTVEIISVLLFDVMNWKDHLAEVSGKAPEAQWATWHNPELQRDRFILSKGHGVPSWYAALALGKYIAEDELSTLRSTGSRLQGHPERKRFPFVDGTTGSLGQGQSEALGYALAMKLQGRTERVFCIIGDGESNEGQVWETALAAAKFKADNLYLFVDFNKKQGEGTNKEIMDIEPLHEKWRAFRWDVQRVDGHDPVAIKTAIQNASSVLDMPHVIIADTHKGYLGNGELFMDGAHNPVIDKATLENALATLGIAKYVL